MLKVGKGILDKLCEKMGYTKSYRFGFHLPPYNSVDHVHLHCFILPFTNILKEKVAYGRLLIPVEKII
jgi:hypothetical protein